MVSKRDVLQILWTTLVPLAVLGCATEDTVIDIGKHSPTANPAVTLIAQGDVALADGRSGEITLEVPKDVISITISVVGKPGETYTICRWNGPDGVLVEDGWQKTSKTQCKACKNYLRTHERVFAVVAPNNPAAAVGPGLHTLSICGEAELAPSVSQVRVAVHVKHLPKVPTTGKLDLNLHFTGAEGLVAAKAQSDPAITAALQELRTIFGQVGVSIERVTWSDVSSKHQVLQLMDNASDPFARAFDLFAEAAGKAAAGVDVFFVERFTGQGGNRGWAGGIPGPPLVHGAEGSGVVIALVDQGGIKLSLGQVLAHELGHYLGLFHTGEAVDWLADPLPDTAGKDAANLMYYAPAGTKLSEWQGRVLRFSPWVLH